ncbi:MAG: DUF1593 domain-containing protein [Spirosomataceae bacterium]
MAQTKPRLIVMTDIGGDPDDQQSLVRLLVHSDQLDIEGLLTTSRLEHGQDTKPTLIEEQLTAYAQVYPNLSKHSVGFPSPMYLRSLIKAGNGHQNELGEGHDTPASDWLIQQVDKPDPRPVWVSIWGGQRELAQALWKIKNTRSSADLTAFIAKLRIYAIGNQDGHERWILDTFPHLFFISSGFIQYGYPHSPKIREYSAYRGMYMTGDESLTSHQWVQDHVVQSHGDLGKLYPADAAGKKGMKEGDSPAFLGLLPNGLNIPEHPEWGGFGGRFRVLKNTLYTDIVDFQAGIWNERLSVSRWRSYFQNDFASRMDWCVKSFADANHPPKAVINNDWGLTPIEIAAQAGQKIKLSAKGSSDPDGHALHYRWWNYWETGNYGGRVSLVNTEKMNSYFNIPHDAKSGTLFHIILEITDSGSPALTSFRRAIVRVK